ncbi:MAG TPA: hypothetical protein VK604_03875 [Bryobacteraceae bacterium]|nr:hypothetical protein [Bryobacteraceae bacterium]
MRDHIKILGIMNIVMGGLTALAGIAVLLLMGGLASVIAASLRASMGDSDGSAIAAPIIATIGLGIAIFLLLLAAPSVIGGIGLLQYKPWSRVLMIIVSGFHLLSVPLGTALGVYGLWVLLSEEGRRILESGGAALPAGVGYPPQQQPIQPY